MKISLTGASGHIGANLCRRLIRDNQQVTVLSNRYTSSLEGLDLRMVQGSLNDPAALEQLVDGAEIVIHLAAAISINGKRESLYDTNVTGTENVLRIVGESRAIRLIHFSSIHAYRYWPTGGTLDETRPLALEDNIPYNRSKAIGHRMVLDAVESGMNAVIICPTSVMGPHDYKPSLIGQAIIQLYNGKIPALVPGGYDWVDVRDVVEGTLRAIRQAKTGESYLLSGHFLDLEEIYQKISAFKGSRRKLPVIPFWLAETGVPFLKAWAVMTGSKPLYTRESVKILKTAHRAISSRKAENDLGYRARPFDETLEDTLRWFGEKNYL